MLIRYCNGERKVWGIIRVPAADDEDRRQLHRELIELKAERTAHVNAIKGLLAGLGLQSSVDEDFPERLDQFRQWDGTAVPAGLRGRLLQVSVRSTASSNALRRVVKVGPEDSWCRKTWCRFTFRARKINRHRLLPPMKRDGDEGRQARIEKQNGTNSQLEAGSGLSGEAAKERCR